MCWHWRSLTNYFPGYGSSERRPTLPQNHWQFKPGSCRGSSQEKRNAKCILWLWTKSMLTHWGRDKNDRLFADDTFKRIFLTGNIRISTKNSLKFVPKGLINNIPALLLIMAWRRPGDKPLPEPMLVRSLTHICVTWPQWVNLWTACVFVYVHVLTS